MYFRIGRVILAIGVIVTSFPLSVIVMERGFGLGAMLTVPTCCLGLWFAVVSPRRSSRIGWFAFSSVCLFLLPACPWWQQEIEIVLNWVQDYLRGPRPTLLYSGAETLALLMMILVPWGSGCVLGRLAAIVARSSPEASDHKGQPQSQSDYQITLRGLLVVILVCGAVTAWLANTVTQWNTQQDTRRQLFLQHFARSFTSGKVTLLAEPEIAEDRALMKGNQNPSGVSEYRVVAPILKNGRELWAAWTYLSHDMAAPGTVSRFGYAEAAAQGGLPPAPFPATEYLRWPNNFMIDGEPDLRITAELMSATTVAKAGDTITIVAKTDPGMKCDLVFHQFQAVLVPYATITAPRSGVVRWEVKLNPSFRGSRVDYDIQARPYPLYRAQTVSGALTIERLRGDEQLRERADWKWFDDERVGIPPE